MKQQLNFDKDFFFKKSLGQNFIHDQEFLRKLNAKIISDHQTVIYEVGPGKGALTDHLIQKNYHTINLIEKDEILCKYLKVKYKSNKQIKIINEDALNFQFNKIDHQKDIVIVGNLPFNISSQLLINWLSEEVWPPFYNRMYLMFQKELANRIIATKDSKNYGKLSVLTQIRCDVEKLLIAPSTIFRPKPKIDGIVLGFCPNNNYPDIDFKKLKSILSDCFNQRRKKISNTLSLYSSKFSDWNVKKDLRPENLDINDFYKLSKM